MNRVPGVVQEYQQVMMNDRIYFGEKKALATFIAGLINSTTEVFLV